jgi:hypothetical protein
LLVVSACVGFRSGLLRLGTGGATASDIAGTAAASLFGGCEVIPAGTGIVHFKEMLL